MFKKKKKAQVVRQSDFAMNSRVDNTIRNAGPTAQKPVIVAPIPNSYSVVANGYGIAGKMELPNYLCTDEYGRVYQANITYGTMGFGGPVPVPQQSSIIQTDAIRVPYNN